MDTKQIQADLFNFTFDIISSNGNSYKVFLPQPNAQEIKMLAPILGRIFTELRSEKLDTIVMLKDWELIVENATADLNDEKASNILTTLNNFFDRSILSATIVDESGIKVEHLDDDEQSYFKGTLLFISALYRYSLKASLKSDLRDYFTSSTCSEWLKQFVSGKEVNTAAKELQVKV